MTPGYIELFKNGELHKRKAILKEMYKECRLCPHQCGVDRTNGGKGVCSSGSNAVIASYTIHHGEEPPVSGHAGSGTTFFTGCTGRCLFCQNYPVSQLGTGNEVSDECLAEMMLELQKSGCHNINLVTPTHFIPSIVSALLIAASKGLLIPIVYNTSGYELYNTIKLLDGVVDIYLPDAKYADNAAAERISGFPSYVEHNRSSLIEMFRQAGNLQRENGVAIKGLIVRHLILPAGLSGTDEVLFFVSKNLSKDLYLSLMDQYFPAYNALNNKELSSRISQNDYDEAIESFYRHGLHNGWIQEHVTV